MTFAATSLAAALWDRYGRIDAICQSSRKDITADAADVLLH